MFTAVASYGDDVTRVASLDAADLGAGDRERHLRGQAAERLHYVVDVVVGLTLYRDVRRALERALEISRADDGVTL